ncbi:hypothetical protein AB4865_06695 [Capnocytophaga sp. ARDL2]|uniref:hypothetical protein n=1 Tax=Capnocytophaga sp. ARDL2 TaxID=3238809 RepID=UPI0035566EF8
MELVFLNKYIKYWIFIFFLHYSTLIAQDRISFREFEQNLIDGEGFTESEIVKINNYSFVKIKGYEILDVFLPVVIDFDEDNELKEYCSGGYLLIYDKNRKCFFEIRVDRRGICLEKGIGNTFNINAELFYEFTKDYSVGIDIKLITHERQKYWFQLVERENKMIVYAKCLDNSYNKVLEIDGNLNNLFIDDIFEKILLLDFNRLESMEKSFYFRNDI